LETDDDDHDDDDDDDDDDEIKGGKRDSLVRSRRLGFHGRVMMRGLMCSSSRYGNQGLIALDNHPPTVCRHDVQQVKCLGGDDARSQREEMVASDPLPSGGSATTVNTDDELCKPVKEVEDKWKLLPHFLQLRGLMRQHIDSFNFFVNKDIKNIVQAASNREVGLLPQLATPPSSPPNPIPLTISLPLNPGEM